MGDANVRRPVATRFEHGVDFGLLVHKSPFMADKRDPLVLSNYIFELLEVNPGVAGFLIQLHTEDVDAVVELTQPRRGGGGGLGLCRAAVPPHRVCRVTRGRRCVVLCCAVLCCVVLCWNLPL